MWKLNSEKSNEYTQVWESQDCPIIELPTGAPHPVIGSWWVAHVRWDGCTQLWQAGNVPYHTIYGEAGEDRDEAACDGSIHLCDLDDAARRIGSLYEETKNFTH